MSVVSAGRDPRIGEGIADPYGPILKAWRSWGERLTRAQIGSRSMLDSEYLEPMLRKLRRLGWIQIYKTRPQTFGIDNDPFT